MPDAVSGVNAIPMPTPSSSIGPTTCGKYGASSVSWLIHAIPANASDEPAGQQARVVEARASRGTTRTIANIASVIGRNAMPGPQRAVAVHALQELA